MQPNGVQRHKFRRCFCASVITTRVRLCKDLKALFSWHFYNDCSTARSMALISLFIKVLLKRLVHVLETNAESPTEVCRDQQRGEIQQNGDVESCLPIPGAGENPW